MEPRRTLTGPIIYALLLCRLEGQALSSTTSNCQEVNVTGGTSPGTYASSGLFFDGKEAWTQTKEGEVAAVLRYLNSSTPLRRRRLEHGSPDDGDGREVEEGVLGASDTFEQQFDDRPGPYNAVRRATEQATTSRRSLTTCASGFWVSLVGAGVTSSSDGAEGAAYPVSIATDCADHPADITAGWLSLACVSCELEDPDPEISIDCSLEPFAESPSPTGGPQDTSGLEISEITSSDDAGTDDTPGASIDGSRISGARRGLAGSGAGGVSGVVFVTIAGGLLATITLNHIPAPWG